MPAAAPEFIVDWSVVMAWCFLDEATPYAMGILERLRESTALAPALWRLESANALLVAERRRRITQKQAVDLAAFLTALPIGDDMDAVSRGLGAVLDLARAHGLSVYDAAYLEVAIRLGLPLATLDRTLRNSAKRAGVALLA